MMPLLVGIVAAVATLAGAWIFGARDPDAGGYADGFRTFALMPDKLIHAGVSVGLTLWLALWMPWYAAAAVAAAAGFVFEFRSGSVKAGVWMLDFLADLVGVALAVASLLGAAELRPDPVGPGVAITPALVVAAAETARDSVSVKEATERSDSAAVVHIVARAKVQLVDDSTIRILEGPPVVVMPELVDIIATSDARIVADSLTRLSLERLNNSLRNERDRWRYRAEELAGLNVRLEEQLERHRGRSWLGRQWEAVDGPVMFLAGAAAGGAAGYAVARTLP